MMIPTFGLLGYGISLALIVFFRLAYIGWVGPYFLALSIGAPILLLALSLGPMLRLRLRISAPETCVRGDSAWLRLEFSGLKLLPAPRILLVLQIENRFTGEITRRKLSWSHVGNGLESVQLPTEWCGNLRCQVLRYEIRDYMGLFSLLRRTPLLAEMTVLPQAEGPQQGLNIEAALNSAVVLKPKYGGGYSEEHELREYRPGDTVNSIHWKLSSKTDQVIVREPLINANTDLFLVLSRVGKEDRGLSLLYWLSLELVKAEQPHIIVADRQYPVGNESEAAAALSGILSQPMGEPCAYDASRARCVFLISEGEVRVR